MIEKPMKIEDPKKRDDRMRAILDRFVDMQYLKTLNNVEFKDKLTDDQLKAARSFFNLGFLKGVQITIKAGSSYVNVMKEMEHQIRSGFTDFIKD